MNRDSITVEAGDVYLEAEPGRRDDDGVADAAAAAWCDDPVAVQQAVCAELARLGPDVDASDLAATLVALDGAARSACERLLACYAEGDAQQRAFDRKYFVAAARLARAMGAVCEVALRRAGADAVSARDARMATAIVHLLAYRQVEYVLRMFRYKRRNATQWQALNEVYRQAVDLGVHRHEVAIDAGSATASAATTAEHQYLQLLLLEAINEGQLSPRQVLQSRAWIARWSRALHLRAGAGAAGAGWGVDLDGPTGPMRNPLVSGHRAMHVDAGLLTAMVDEDARLARGSAAADPDAQSATDARIALLARLRRLLDPAPPPVDRRGERSPASGTVEVCTGLSRVVHMLRLAALESAKARRGRRSGTPALGAAGGAPPATTAVTLGPTALMPVIATERWHLKDASATGCRLRGKPADLIRIVPGSLLALRAVNTDAWSLVVVRRLRRLMVDHIELGVEYVGRHPSFVKVVIDSALDPASGRASPARTKCLGALYVPPGNEPSAVPLRTLLLPARDGLWPARVTLLAADAVYDLRLHDPIRREEDFVLVPFTVVGKAGAEGAAGL